MRKGLPDDAALFDAIVHTNRTMSYAREEVAKALGVENRDVAWRIDAEDRVVFTLMEGDRARVQTAIQRRLMETGLKGRVVVE